MSVLEVTPEVDDDAAPEPRTVVLKLYPDATELLDELMARTGWDASELVGWALGAYWRELEGIPLEPFEKEDVDEMVRQGLEDIAAGRTYSNEEVFAELRAKFGR